MFVYAVCMFLFLTSADLCFGDTKKIMLMTGCHFFENRQNVAAHLDKVTIMNHDIDIKITSLKRVVSWLDDHKVSRNFPVALLNKC